LLNMRGGFADLNLPQAADADAHAHRERLALALRLGARRAVLLRCRIAPAVATRSRTAPQGTRTWRRCTSQTPQRSATRTCATSARLAACRVL
jgi:hypothetical protein